MTFEWDEAENEWTKEFRGFDFDYASTVFLDSVSNRGPGSREGQRGTALRDWQGHFRRNSICRFCLETLSRTKKSAASSQPGKLVRRSEADIRKYAKSAAARTFARSRSRTNGRGPERDPGADRRGAEENVPPGEGTRHGEARRRDSGVAEGQGRAA